MDLLVVMTGMNAGGAEKSLISFLSALTDQNDIPVNIDLLLFTPRGMFMKQLPPVVSLIEYPKEIFCMSNSVNDKLFIDHICPRGLVGKIYHLFRKVFIRNHNLDDIQFMWKNWKSFIPNLDKHYDVALSYMHGATNYFVIDKCNANKKYLYVHHEYSKLPSYHNYDKAYFSKSTGIITVSPQCVRNILAIYPEFAGKVHSIDNICIPALIHKMADIFFPEEYSEINGRKILLSIGRLIQVKRFDRIIEAASYLKDKNISFVWFIIGTGPLLSQYQDKVVEKGLSEYISFLGERENPYPYIKYADIFIQTSDNEGKSIVLDEAKILAKPIVVTNYATVHDSIENGVTGIIVDRDPISVAKGIERLILEDGLIEKLVSELNLNNYGNTSELQRYFELWGWIPR